VKAALGLAALVGAALAFTGSRPLHAEPPSGAATTAAPSAREVAKQRYRDGVKAFQEGRLRDAIDLFLEADKLAPSAALSFNIARAYEEQKDAAHALEWYRHYLRRSPDAPDRDEVTKKIAGFENQLEKKGVQQLTVLSDPPGATVVIDDRPLGVTPWTGELAPGSHALALRLRGYDDVARAVSVNAEHAGEVSMRLVPAADKPPATVAAAPGAAPQNAALEAPSRESSAAERGVRVWTWAALGAGAGVLGAAGVFELLRRNAESDAEADRTQIGRAEKLDTMESRQTTARVLAGVGGALVLTGGVLLVLDLSRSKRSETPAVAAGCGDQACGIVVNGAF